MRDLRRYLKCINRVIGALHMYGTHIMHTLCWRKLKKNPPEYLPASVKYPDIQLQVIKLKNELRAVQHIIEKKFELLDGEIVTKRIV